MKLYFAYGANLNMDGMGYRCPRAVPVRPFHLKDWRLAFSGVATIQPSPGDYVPGAVWELTEECECNLDTFEGYPYLYRKHTVKIDGDEIMFYVMNSDPPQEPSISYLITIAEGYQDWHLDLDDLWNAVKTTQEEYYYELQLSPRTKHGSSHRNVEKLVRLESGNDLRQFCDLGDPNTDSDTIYRST
jgi:gamma-glutamylcyclotransferase (GGCT)/AIG2-like uncharacterized protein YtfP